MVEVLAVVVVVLVVVVVEFSKPDQTERHRIAFAKHPAAGPIEQSIGTAAFLFFERLL